jgi:hypothetical protein
MGTYTAKWLRYWQITFAISLLWLAGCSLGLRSDPDPPPTAVSSPTPTIIATFTAVPTLAKQETPSATPEPTATNTRQPTATATTPPPTSTPLPTPLPTLTADQLEEELLPALIFQEVANEFRYPIQRVTWEYGLRPVDYCQHGSYRWLNDDHLLLYPLVGQNELFQGNIVSDLTWPIVTNLHGQPAWGVDMMPQADGCILPEWSAVRQQLIEVDEAVRLRDLAGNVVQTYDVAGLLHLAPSGQRLLVGNVWLDLENGRIVELPEWQVERAHVPGWTADETRLFACCFNYADVTTGEGWTDSAFIQFGGRGSWPGEAVYSTNQWLAGENHILFNPIAIFPTETESNSTGSRFISPLIEPITPAYDDLLTLSGMADVMTGCAVSASQTGDYIWLSCGSEAGLMAFPAHEMVWVTETAGSFSFQGWSADGRFLTYNEFDDEDWENGRVWLLSTDGERRQLSDEPASQVWWHPTEPLLALRLSDPQRLRLVQAETGQERSLEMLDPVEDLVWQQDGEGLALQTADNRIWWLSRPFQPRPYRLPTVPIPLTAPHQGQTLHSLRWSPDGTKLAYVHDNHLSVIIVDAGPQTVSAEALDFTIDLPPRWVMVEVEGMPLFASDERFGDWPTPMHYFVYAQEYPNPEERPFAELVTTDLSDEIRANFSYTTETIGPYTVHRSELMPSMSGALTVFFELPGRYLALALTPYDSEQPYQDQDRYLDLFEAMLQAVVVGQ